MEEEATGIKIQTLNKILEQHDQQLLNEKNQLSLLDIKELRERWFTKKELNFMQQNGIGIRNSMIGPSLTNQ